MNIKLDTARMYIGGEWTEADGGRRFDVTNPSNGAVVGSVPDGGEAETERAVAAASEAFAAWSRTTVQERSELLYKWYEIAKANLREIAEIMSLESGKPLKESLGEMNYGLSFIQWYAEEAKRNYGRVIPSFVPDKRILTIQQPVGVAAAITPWNFPCAMATRKLAPALAAGCTVILKPAEQTPLTAVAMFQCAEEAGFPSGVLNLITGDPVRIGRTILADKRVRKISFTGSTEVGKLLLRGAADSVKRVSLELGGNAPFIVFDDADLKQAVKGAMASKFRNAGQTCVCANRFYVHEQVAEAFTRLMVEEVSALRVGDAFAEQEPDIGPLIEQAGLDKVLRHVDDAVAKGAEVRCGGRRLDGLFYEPTVLTGITQEMQLSHEETFGPIVPIRTFRTEDEVIEMANDTVYGLAAYVYTNDLNRSIRMYEALDYGMVGLNDGMLSTVQIPFGGKKESGLGREGGSWGMESFLETKYVSIGHKSE